MMKRRTLLIAVGLLLGGLLAWSVPRMIAAWGQVWSHVEDPVRDAQPQTSATIAALALEPGMVVADVGAGVGYYSFKVSRLVGPTGRVYATDVDPFAIAALWTHRLLRGYSNVVPRLVDGDRLELAASSVDRILIFNVYPFEKCRSDRTRALLADASAALRPRGRLVLYQDWVHDESWEAPLGTGPECAQPDGNELAQLAREQFDVVRLDENPLSATPHPGEQPGYLLVLERRAPSAEAES